MTLLQSGIAKPSSGYDIEQSLRFDDGNTVLYHYPDSAYSDGTRWTLSTWIKLEGEKTSNTILLHGQASNTGNDDEDRTYLGWWWDESGYRFFYNVRRSNAWETRITFTPQLSDFSAWYHVLFVYNSNESSADDRIKFYLNGVLQTDRTTTDSVSSGATSFIMLNGGLTNVHGHWNASAPRGPGYLADFHWIDGQALTTADFGETDSDTNQWKPIEYAGTYGNSGFYFKFQDSSNLGDDSSGNGHDFTNYNLVASDQVTDSPTQNHATLNQADAGSGTLSEGSLKSTGTTDRSATFLLSSGKWAWKVTADAAGDFGVASNGLTGTESTYSASSSEVLEFELDLDANTLKVRVDGGGLTSVATGLTADAYVPLFKAACTCDFGQSGFSPTDGTFKTLNTNNLSNPSIADSTKHFNTILYDDGSGAKTGVGFQPDLVWVKSRGSAYEYELTDSVRGVTKALSSDSTNAESTDSTGLTAFGSDGFTVGADTNYSDTTGSGMVAWNWKAGGTAVSNGDGTETVSLSANPTAGFSIIAYTGTGTTDGSDTVGHGLNQAPELYFVKARTEASHDWNTYAEPIGVANYVALNLTGASAAQSNGLNHDEAPTSSVITLGSWNAVNESAKNFVIYAFHSVEGYSKVGSYAGNGVNGDGTFVYVGFLPAFVFIKRVTNSGSNSYIVDNKRIGYNGYNSSTDYGSNKYLWPDSTAAEGNGTAAKGMGIDLVSNGFKIRSNSSDYNASGDTYIYLAIAESPFKTSNAR